MQDNMPSCTLLNGFSRELHSADYSWVISIQSPRAYFINSGGGYPKEPASKVHSVWQLKVDSGHTFACFGSILRV
jgi:hypothetical protein